jgi:hypothetical protein
MQRSIRVKFITFYKLYSITYFKLQAGILYLEDAPYNLCLLIKRYLFNF